MPQTSTPSLSDGRSLTLVQAAPGDTPANLVQALGNPAPGLVVLLAGGDDELPAALRPRLAQVVGRGLVRGLAEAAGDLQATALCLVRASGSGLPALVGQAVASGQGALRLLGIGPEAALALPGQPRDGDDARAQPVAGLSALLTVPGAWDDVPRCAAELAQALARTDPSTRPDGSARPPRRVLMVVVGGREGPGGTLAEVLGAVRRGWPVLLVQGSGGLADALVAQAQDGVAANEDPDVAEILADGQLSWVTLGDKAAPAVEALARLVNRECGGDSVLRQTWQRFAALDQAALREQDSFGRVQAWILVLGVLVVAISVANASWRAPEDLALITRWLGFDVSATAWQRLKDAMGYALIVTPICVATLVAIGNRFSPGKRWVLLRSAAESIKREIYRYRVRPLSGGNDGSREKALQQAVEDITRRLARTEANTIGLPPYTGPFPPPNALAKGDDGMRMLGTGHYVRLRLLDQMNWYRNKTDGLYLRGRNWQVAAMVIGALGSLLAALQGHFADWVALTTALASAALAYLGYKQFDTTLTGYNQTATDMENLLSWWTALRPDEQAQSDNVDTLVRLSEGVMATEQNSWAQSMTNALESLRDAQRQKYRDPKDPNDDDGDGGGGGSASGSRKASIERAKASTR